MTRNEIAYRIIRVWNPSQDDEPELYRFDAYGAVMLRVYQLRRWPKAKLLQVYARCYLRDPSKGEYVV